MWKNNSTSLDYEIREGWCMLSISFFLVFHHAFLVLTSAKFGQFFKNAMQIPAKSKLRCLFLYLFLCATAFTDSTEAVKSYLKKKYVSIKNILMKQQKWLFLLHIPVFLGDIMQTVHKALLPYVTTVALRKCIDTTFQRLSWNNH